MFAAVEQAMLYGQQIQRTDIQMKLGHVLDGSTEYQKKSACEATKKKGIIK